MALRRKSKQAKQSLAAESGAPGAPVERRFVGETLAAVLATVQTELGAEAQITSAQKVRTGGALGFFQRERFEVLVNVTPATTIEVGDDAEVEDSSPLPTGATSLLALAEQMNTVERRFDDSGTERTETGEKDGSERPISTETGSFAEVLSRVAFQADLRSPEPFASGSTTDEAAPPRVVPVPLPARPSAPAPAALPVAYLVPDRPAALNERIEPLPATIEPPAALRTRITDHPLAVLGLPVRYIPSAVDSSMQKALTASLADLPKAPVVRPGKGSIVVVVGERNEAVELAGDLAHKWGRPREEVVLASAHHRGRGGGRVLRSVRGAEDARRSWSRRSRPTIVAIDAYPGSRDTSWAEHMLTALEPVATWGVADATRKAEDVASWAEALGGVDCLALNHIDETVSPASVLSAGIPVERIDGRKATSAYWAALLTDRLPV